MNVLTPPPRRRRSPIAIGVAAAAALSVLGVLYLRRLERPFLSWEEIDELERWPVLEEA